MSQIWVVLNLSSLEAEIKSAEESSDFAAVAHLSSAGQNVIDKIKSLTMQHGGTIVLSRPTKIVFQMPHTIADEFEMAVTGYQQSLKTDISVGMGITLAEARNACRKSMKTGEIEFYHEEDSFYLEEQGHPEKENLAADKKPQKEQQATPAPSIEESEQIKAAYVDALAQQQIQPAVQAQEEAAMAQQEQMQAAANEIPHPETQQGKAPMPEEDQMRDQLFEGVAPKEEKSEDKIEMDPAKKEIDTKDPKYKIAGLLATIREHWPAMAEMSQKDPEAFRAMMKLVGSSLKISKNVRDHGYEMLKKMRLPAPTIKKKDLNKAFGLPKYKKRFLLKWPVGTLKDGKLKTRNPNDGNERWRGVRTGIQVSPDGEQISTKELQRISHLNEIGKKELDLAAGYELSHWVDKDGFHNIDAIKNGNQVGYAKFSYDYKPDPTETHLTIGDYLKGWDVWVHPEHRRRGLASAMYKLAESKSGKKIMQGGTTPEGSALWAQPNRPFGKSELRKEGFNAVPKLPLKNDGYDDIRNYLNDANPYKDEYLDTFRKMTDPITNNRQTELPEDIVIAGVEKLLNMHHEVHASLLARENPSSAKAVLDKALTQPRDNRSRYDRFLWQYMRYDGLLDQKQQDRILNDAEYLANLGPTLAEHEHATPETLRNLLKLGYHTSIANKNLPKNEAAEYLKSQHKKDPRNAPQGVRSFLGREDADSSDVRYWFQNGDPGLRSSILHTPGIVNKMSDADIIKYYQTTDLNNYNEQVPYRAAIQHLKDRGLHEDKESVNVSFGTAKIRQARDIAEKNGGKATKKMLEMAGIKPQELGIQHLQDASGNISAEKLQDHIDRLPKFRYGVSHDRYGSNDFDASDYVDESDHMITPDPTFDEEAYDEDFNNAMDLHMKSFNPDEMEELDPSLYKKGKKDPEYAKDLEYYRQQHERTFSPRDYGVDKEHARYWLNHDPELDKDSYNQAVDKARDDYLNDHALDEQRHNSDLSSVFQLNMTPEHAKQMKEAGVWDTFRNVHSASERSGHPASRGNGIGWVRYTRSYDGPMIDEIQSDFGSNFQKIMAQQAKQAKESGQISPEQETEANQKAAEKYPQQHLEKIKEILFGGKDPNEVLHEAFHQHLRDRGHHGQKVHIWDIAGKAPISLGENWNKGELFTFKGHQFDHMREKMGDIKGEEIGNAIKDLWGNKYHETAKSYIKTNNLPNWEAFEQHVRSQPRSELHIRTEKKAPAHMLRTYSQQPPKLGYKPATYGELYTQNNPNLDGQPTWATTLRRKENEITDLIKSKLQKHSKGYELETKQIKENSEGPGQEPHEFKAARWTFPNGHPRCLICGDEERIGGCKGRKFENTELRKTPYISERNYRAASNIGPLLSNKRGYLRSYKIGQSVVHHWADNEDSLFHDFTVHEIPEDPRSPVVGSVNIGPSTHDPDYTNVDYFDTPQVYHSSVLPAHRGRGLGTLMYEAAAKFFGKQGRGIVSSTALSPASDAVYRKLKRKSGLRVRLGRKDNEPHVLGVKAKKR